MYQVQGSCARLREDIIEEIENAINLIYLKIYKLKYLYDT